MVETILVAIVIALSGVIAFLLYSREYDRKKAAIERENQRSFLWRTVFERTDLRREEVHAAK